MFQNKSDLQFAQYDGHQLCTAFIHSDFPFLLVTVNDLQGILEAYMHSIGQNRANRVYIDTMIVLHAASFMRDSFFWEGFHKNFGVWLWKRLHSAKAHYLIGDWYPQVSSVVGVRALCRQLEFFHANDDFIDLAFCAGTLSCCSMFGAA